MGLANRVVPKGRGRAAAELLAREIAAFPQECMRNDRRSAHDQFALELDEAIRLAPNGTTKVAYLTDPWGTRIELTQNLAP